MKRIGLMGCGVVADYGHSHAIAQTDGLSLAALYDPNPEALARLAARYPDAHAFTDIEAFWRCGLDAVSITSPAPVHLDNLRGAAQHGLHVLCEKPLGMDEDEIEEMIALADKAGILFATALCYRFSPVAQRIKQLIDEGVIGELRAQRLIYLWNLHGKWETDAHGNRFESARRLGRFEEGGPLVDCGVHQIDLALWWTGSEVVRQHAAAAWIEEHEAPGHVWMHMDHASGCHTCVEISFSYTHTARDPYDIFTYELIGTEGLIRYVRDGWFFEVRNGQGTVRLPGASEKDFHGMYAAWRDALYTGNLGNVPSARDGLHVTQLSRRATEAAMATRYRK
jgi:predicted dehydrogenase